jgi:hypothetical protein
MLLQIQVIAVLFVVIHCAYVIRSQSQDRRFEEMAARYSQRNTERPTPATEAPHLAYAMMNQPALGESLMARIAGMQAQRVQTQANLEMMMRQNDARNRAEYELGLSARFVGGLAGNIGGIVRR